MSGKDIAQDPSLWVPICCQNVMRHNRFESPDGSVLATLVCVSCGKQVTLQAHTSDSLEEFGDHSRVLSVLAVSRPRRNAKSSAPGEPPSEETL